MKSAVLQLEQKGTEHCRQLEPSLLGVKPLTHWEQTLAAEQDWQLVITQDKQDGVVPGTSEKPGRQTEHLPSSNRHCAQLATPHSTHRVSLGLVYPDWQLRHLLTS